MKLIQATIQLCILVCQATRECLKRHIQDFGEQLRKENEVGLIIDGQVSLRSSMTQSLPDDGA